MNDESLSFNPEQFAGLARVFPLPNLVMFPHVMQAMHIFEPRYRALFEEAIEDDQLITLGVLEPGWEADYEGRPPLQKTACLCRIASHQRTPEGTYNVLLLGVRRLQLGDECPPAKPFRVFEAEILDDHLPAQLSPEAGNAAQRQLLSAFKRAMPKIPDSYDQLDQLLGNQITLGMLTDIVAYTVDMALSVKTALLAEQDVYRRTQMLLEALGSQVPPTQAQRTFPPAFSLN
jgi:Lon protease-like protein